MSRRPRLLYVASRWPWPVESGRKRMIDQALSMAAEHFDVELAAFVGRCEKVEQSGPRTGHLLTRPSVGEIALNCMRHPARPLQTNLFASHAAAARLRVILEDQQPDVVILDMLRLAPYGRIVRQVVPEARLVLDLDDLLSRRYRQMRSRRENGILGAFTAGMPGPVQALARLAPLPILAFEENAVKRAERHAVHENDAVMMVSEHEADVLRKLTEGADIHAVPPAVVPAFAPRRDFGAGVRFVFLGNEHYRPNAEALGLLEPIARDVLKGASVVRPVSFVSCGRRDEMLETPSIERHGFVDSLDDFLGADTVMVAPIMTGTGIKTKVLDAMARGVPVIGLPKAFEGLDVVANKHVIQCDDLDALQRMIGSIATSRGLDHALSLIGVEGAKFISEVHDWQTVRGAFCRAVGITLEEAVEDSKVA